MYLWEKSVLDDALGWVNSAPAFVQAARPLFTALCGRGVHLGRHADPMGLQGWLTPEEASALGALLAALPRPERGRLEQLGLDPWGADVEHENLQRVMGVCSVAEQQGRGVAYALDHSLREARKRSRLA